jgi:glutaredoxin-related protein
MVRSNPLETQRRLGGDLPSILKDDNDVVMQDDLSFLNLL